jgi:hypothetical protein
VLANLLVFTHVYFCESRLFNGLQRKKNKKIEARLKLCAKRLTRFFHSSPSARRLPFPPPSAKRRTQAPTSLSAILKNHTKASPVWQEIVDFS